MSRKLISTGSPFEKVAGYSRAVADGPWCFVSGTTGYDYETMIMPEEPSQQTLNALKTIEKALLEAGFAMTDIVRARYVVTDPSYVDDVFKALGSVLGDIRPAATMTVSQLIKPEMKVEIDVTAYKPD